MSWHEQRPIYKRLPSESGNWQGNQAVNWLTSFWDELLVQHKDNLGNPTDWLGTAEQVNEYFLDWLGIGLCGYGPIWDSRFTDRQKRDLIAAYGQAYNRVSVVGLTACVSAIIPGASIQDSKPARADFAYSDVSTVTDPLDTSYQINVPVAADRNSRSWRQLERVLDRWAPIGESRVQFDRLMADRSIVGDTVTIEQSIGYLAA